MTFRDRLSPPTKPADPTPEPTPEPRRTSIRLSEIAPAVFEIRDTLRGLMDEPDTAGTLHTPAATADDEIAPEPAEPTDPENPASSPTSPEKPVIERDLAEQTIPIARPPKREKKGPMFGRRRKMPEAQ